MPTSIATAHSDDTAETQGLAVPLDDKPFFTPGDLKKRWGIAENTLARWRVNGTGPVYSKIGGRVLYQRADVEDWEHSQRQTGMRRA